jgi:hypothetical protein
MKNLLILTILALGFSVSLSAQTTFNAGDIEFASGIGIFGTFAKDGADINVPPLSARLGVRVSPKFSLAAYAAYSASELNGIEQADGSIKNVENEFTILGLRAAAHNNPRENLDVYGGIMLGYNIPNVNETVNGAPKSDEIDGPSFSRPAENEFTYSAFVGAAYYPVKKLGIFAEVGYGISILSTGVTLKL